MMDSQAFSNRVRKQNKLFTFKGLPSNNALGFSGVSLGLNATLESLENKQEFKKDLERLPTQDSYPAMITRVISRIKDRLDNIANKPMSTKKSFIKTFKSQDLFKSCSLDIEPIDYILFSSFLFDELKIALESNSVFKQCGNISKHSLQLTLNQAKSQIQNYKQQIESLKSQIDRKNYLVDRLFPRKSLLVESEELISEILTKSINSFLKVKSGIEERDLKLLFKLNKDRNKISASRTRSPTFATQGDLKKFNFELSKEIMSRVHRLEVIKQFFKAFRKSEDKLSENLIKEMRESNNQLKNRRENMKEILTGQSQKIEQKSIEAFENYIQELTDSFQSKLIAKVEEINKLKEIIIERKRECKIMKLKILQLKERLSNNNANFNIISGLESPEQLLLFNVMNQLKALKNDQPIPKYAQPRNLSAESRIYNEIYSLVFDIEARLKGAKIGEEKLMFIRLAQLNKVLSKVKRQYKILKKVFHSTERKVQQMKHLPKKDRKLSLGGRINQRRSETPNKLRTIREKNLLKIQQKSARYIHMEDDKHKNRDEAKIKKVIGTSKNDIFEGIRQIHLIKAQEDLLGRLKTSCSLNS